MTNNIQSPLCAGVISPNTLVIHLSEKKHREVNFSPVFRGLRYRLSDDTDSGSERVVAATVEVHRVTGETSLGGTSGNRPVSVLLDLRLDVADGRTHVADTEASASLTGGERVTCREVIHDAALLSDGVAHCKLLKDADGVVMRSGTVRLFPSLDFSIRLL